MDFEILFLSFYENIFYILAEDGSCVCENILSVWRQESKSSTHSHLRKLGKYFFFTNKYLTSCTSPDHKISFVSHQDFRISRKVGFSGKSFSYIIITIFWIQESIFSHQETDLLEISS